MFNLQGAKGREYGFIEAERREINPLHNIADKGTGINVTEMIGLKEN